MKRIVVVFTLVVFAESVHLPSTFKKCNRDSPDFDECLKEASGNGVSQLIKPFHQINLPSLDPYKLPKLEIGAGSGPVGVDQNFRDCDIYGFNNVKVNTFRFDFEAHTLHLGGLFPEVKKQCQYQLDGKILLLPIQGEGTSEVILKNLNASCFLKFEEKTKNGKTYIKFLSFHDFVLEPEFASFKFENLFNGNKELGDNINNVINDNWKEIYQDVRTGYETAVAQIFMSLLNGFFSKVSLEEALD